eukprot:1558368-Ditylum_brightwellii.AAC.1
MRKKGVHRAPTALYVPSPTGAGLAFPEGHQKPGNPIFPSATQQARPRWKSPVASRTSPWAPISLLCRLRAP